MSPARAGVGMGDSWGGARGTTRGRRVGTRPVATVPPRTRPRPAHVPAPPASRCLAANDSTNRRVLWFSIGEAVVLVGMGVLQVLYLKSFFERKRAF